MVDKNNGALSTQVPLQRQEPKTGPESLTLVSLASEESHRALTRAILLSNPSRLDAISGILDCMRADKKAELYQPR
jgi:hypothetical protein